MNIEHLHEPVGESQDVMPDANRLEILTADELMQTVSAGREKVGTDARNWQPYNLRSAGLVFTADRKIVEYFVGKDNTLEQKDIFAYDVLIEDAATYKPETPKALVDLEMEAMRIRNCGKIGQRCSEWLNTLTMPNSEASKRLADLQRGFSERINTHSGSGLAA